jgi:hypothetical protein
MTKEDKHEQRIEKEKRRITNNIRKAIYSLFLDEWSKLDKPAPEKEEEGELLESLEEIATSTKKKYVIGDMSFCIGAGIFNTYGLMNISQENANEFGTMMAGIGSLFFFGYIMYKKRIKEELNERINQTLEKQVKAPEKLKNALSYIMEYYKEEKDSREKKIEKIEKRIMKSYQKIENLETELKNTKVPAKQSS